MGLHRNIFTQYIGFVLKHIGVTRDLCQVLTIRASVNIGYITMRQDADVGDYRIQQG